VNYLLDANVLSEKTKVKPDPSVEIWLSENEADLVVDPIILGEIQLGIYLLPAGTRSRPMRNTLAGRKNRWENTMLGEYGNRTPGTRSASRLLRARL